MLAVEHDPVGDEALLGELVERAVAGDPERGRHPEVVALLVRCVPDADCEGPPANSLRAPLPLGGQQHLGVAHAGQVHVRRHDGGDGHRPGPGAPPDLVDPTHDVVVRLPTETFDSQGRIGARAHAPTLPALFWF